MRSGDPIRLKCERVFKGAWGFISTHGSESESLIIKTRCWWKVDATLSGNHKCYDITYMHENMKAKRRPKDDWVSPPPILLLITNVPSFLLLSSFLTGLCFQVSLSLPHMHIFKKMCLICTMMRHNRKEKLDTSVCSKHDSLSSGFFLVIYLFK